MNTITYTFIIFCLCSLSLWSQNRFHSARTKLQLQPTSMVGVLVKGDFTRLQQEISNYNGTITAVSGSIISAQIPAGKVLEFSQLPSVKQFECGVRYYPTNEESVRHSRTDKVHSGQSPLTSTRTGKGVIVGIIDTGIDFFHPEFMKRDQPNKTRIIAIWDQNDTIADNRPNGFSYGAEWNLEQIQATIDGDSIVRHRDINYSAHGTHVAGTAAGLSGHAPDADIIVVGLDWDGTTSLTDASLYMVQKSIELGKPIVINASLGTHEVPHDASDLTTQFIDSLVASHPKVAYVVAAGNEGGSPIHWQVQCTDSVQMTYTQTGTMTSYFELHPNEDLRLQIRLDSLHSANGVVTFHTLNVSEEFVYDQLLEDSLTEFVFTTPMNDTVVTFTMSATMLGTSKELIVSTRYRNPRHFLAFLVKGREKLHAWHWGNWLWYNGNEVGIKGYVPTDPYYSLRAPGTGKNVLTVGAYVNRGEYVNIKADTLGRGLVPGAIASFSSIGPTTDGRLKPEISAPGQNVMSASPTYLVNKPIHRLVGDSITAVNSGTSMATPAVTGIVATYFEAFPTASFPSIIKRITTTALQDSFALVQGDLPNSVWGFGKIDAFALHSLNITSVQQTPVHKPNCTVSSLGNQSMLVTTSLPNVGNYELEVIDVNGKILKTFSIHSSVIGTYSMKLQLHYSGIVLLRVTQGDSILSSAVGINY